MTVAAFDTLKFATALRDRAKMPSEQAEGLATAINEAFQDTGITRRDLDDAEARLDAKIESVRVDLEHRIDALDAKLDAQRNALDAKLDVQRNELDAKMDAQRNELDAKIDALGLDVSRQIAAAKADIVKWMVGAIGFQSVVILGAVVLLARVV